MKKQISGQQVFINNLCPSKFFLQNYGYLWKFRKIWPVEAKIDWKLFSQCVRRDFEYLLAQNPIKSRETWYFAGCDPGHPSIKLCEKKKMSTIIIVLLWNQTCLVTVHANGLCLVQKLHYILLYSDMGHFRVSCSR